MSDLRDRIAALSPAQREALLARLKSRSPQPAGPEVGGIMRHEGRTEYPASPAQERMWFLHKLDPLGTEYAGATAWRLRGPLDRVALAAAIDSVVARHEVLRTTLIQRDEGLMQVVSLVGPAMQTLDLSAEPEEGRLEAARRAIAEMSGAPYDLQAGPLLRIRLVRLTDTDHVLAAAAHHVVSDGWSLHLFASEVGALYGDTRSGLPPLPVQYGDYAVWERAQLDGLERDPSLAYWQQHLKGVRKAPWPQVHGSHAPSQRGAGGAERIRLDERLTSRVRAAAQAARCTPFMVLLAAANVLIYRLTGQRDVVVGTAVANRRRPETAHLIGFFANLVPLRAQVDGAASFAALLEQVRNATLSAVEHQHVPFERLVQDVAAGRDYRESNPVVGLTVTLQTEADGELRLAGLQVTRFDLPPDSPRFELELNVQDRAAWLDVEALYQDAHFDSDAVRGMLGIFTRILSAVTDNASVVVDAIRLVDSPAPLDSPLPGNPPRYPECSIADAFAAQVRERPDALALVHGHTALTYAELDVRARACAGALRRAGVTADTRVGVCLPRGADLIVALLAIVKCGAAYVAIDPDEPVERAAGMFADAGVTVVVSTGGAARGAFPGLMHLDLAVDGSEPDDSAGAVVPVDAVAYVAFTSGSTGRPKGVEVPHRGVLRLLFGQSFANLGPSEVVLQLAPVHFDASTFEIWGALLRGGTLVVYPDRVPTPTALAAELARTHVTTMWLTASLFNAIIDEAPEALRGVRQLLVGGEALSVTHVRRAQAHLPDTTLVNGYGPTENTTFTCCYQVPRPVPESWDSVPLGEPLAATHCHVLDPSGAMLPDGVTGELFVGGAGLARGYAGSPRLTAERFVPDDVSGTPGSRLYRTGDMVRRRDGVFHFLGRRDGQIKLRGHRIELGEVESALARVPGVSRSAARVVGTGDSRRLLGYVVAETGRPLDGTVVRMEVSGVLPSYMRPEQVLVLERLPLTASGKIDRAKLPEAEVATHGAATSMPRGALEERIAAIWCDVLGRDSVGAHENFFDAGGHSLRLLRVHHALEQALGTPIPFVRLFQYPTVSGLASFLARQASVPAAAERTAPAVDPIAIIGMAGRFPGAPDVDRFWTDLRDGRESIRRFTAEELAAASVPVSLRDDPRYVPVRGALEGIDQFDAGLFEFSPRDAALLDPQQRLLLESAWTALEDAGYPPRDPGPVRTGVFVGCSQDTYASPIDPHERAAGTHDAYERLLSNGRDFLATRVSYKLGLTGPAITVQTACSTSLVAVHTACQALQSGECDVALAGGVSITMPVVGGYLYEPEGILSRDGHCRPFDAAAGGTVGGNGVGLVVLKRLSAALRDGDEVRAVLLGAGINNDGADKVGFTAPSVSGQAAAIRAALASAGVEPASIGLIEGHGTGTALGDPIEVAALREVFDASVARGACALGSVKGNVGHLDAAAGVTGLIKAVLALEHGEIPPTLHFQAPSPQVDLGPFYVPSRACAWPEPVGHPRRAGVSSFGMGGTNVHVVLEQAPDRPRPANDERCHVLPISAHTQEALGQVGEALAAFIEAHPELPLADIAWTSQRGRAVLPLRRIVVGRTREEIVAGLRAPAPHRLAASAPPVVWLFPGQGTQAVGMARELYDARAEFRAEFDACADAIRDLVDLDLRRVVYPEPEDSAAAAIHLADTMWTQVGLLAVELALAAQWQSWGLQPDAVVGHSVGELAAAVVAGVLSREEALRLAVVRGRCMGQAPAGGMLAVAVSADEIRPDLGGAVWLAAVNGPSQVVVSGAVEHLQALTERLDARGIDSRRLPAAGAFHSGLMAAVTQPMNEAARQVRWSVPLVPWVSTATGRLVSREEALEPEYWGRQVTAPVLWAEAVEAVRRHVGGSPVWVEMGPGHTLTRLIRRSGDETTACPLGGADAEVGALQALGECWLRGRTPDWRALHVAGPRRHVRLPAYPFQRQRYWIDPEPSVVTSTGKRTDVAQWAYTPGWTRSPLDAAGDSPVSVRLLAFGDHRVVEQACRSLQSAGAQIVRVGAGSAFGRLAPGRFQVVPGSRDDAEALVDDLRRIGELPTHVLYGWPLDDRAAGQAPDECDVAGLLALHAVTRALHVRGVATRLLVLTRGAQDVTGAEVLLPGTAMLNGLAATTALECAPIACRTLDVEAADDDPSAAAVAGAVVAELLASTSDRAVAHRHGQRWVECLTPRLLAATGEVAATRLRTDGVYVITGGFGRMALALAESLAQTATVRIALVGRRTLPDRQRWDEWSRADHGSDEGLGVVLDAIRRIEAAGAEVLAVTADAGDLSAMRSALDVVRSKWGRIDGVIHAAGITSGPTFAPIAELTPDAFLEHVHAKARGARVLSTLVEGQPLDFCLLMSSLSTILGGVGFGAYAAANAFLDAYAAAESRRTGVPWTSIDWDGWSFDAGGRPGGVAERLAMTSAEGVEVFRRILRGPLVPRVAVSTADLAARRRQLQAGRAPGPDTATRQSRAMSSAYSAPVTDTQRVVASIWEELLGVGSIGIHDDFFELGGHSLLGTQALSRMREQLRCPLALADLFASPTIEGLAARVDQVLQQASTDRAASLAQRVKELSPEERARLLEAARRGKGVSS